MNGLDEWLGTDPQYASVDITNSTPVVGGEYDAAPSIIDTQWTLLPTDGARYIDSRVNTENPSGNFLGFDQSKLKASFHDLLNSATGAIGIASQETVRGALKGGTSAGQSWIDKFVLDFRSTRTGKEMEGRATAQKMKEILMMPLTWVIGGVVIYFVFLGLTVRRG